MSGWKDGWEDEGIKLFDQLQNWCECYCVGAAGTTTTRRQNTKSLCLILCCSLIAGVVGSSVV